MSTKLKILLAEDDPYLSRYIQTILNRWDCDLAVEQTAERAIRRAATFKPDVALLGFVTPGMDGAKAGIELVKGSPETRIVLTVESVPSEVLGGSCSRVEADECPPVQENGRRLELRTQTT